MARRRGAPARLPVPLPACRYCSSLCSAEEPLGLAADDAPDFAIGDWLSSRSGPSREERRLGAKGGRRRGRGKSSSRSAVGLAAFFLSEDRRNDRGGVIGRSMLHWLFGCRGRQEGEIPSREVQDLGTSRA